MRLMKAHIALKTLLAGSLMLLVAGCVTTQMPTSTVCELALSKRPNVLAWRTSSRVWLGTSYSVPGLNAGWWAHVTEAKRRGYTPQSCAKALGRTTQVAKSSITTGNKLVSWDQKKLCNYALSAPNKGNRWETEWDTGALYSRHVTEAKRRGYTPESCAKALGRTTQVASSSGTTGNKLASWDQSKLCKYALSSATEGTSWDTRTPYKKYSTEAKRRGLTPEKCGEIFIPSTYIVRLDNVDDKQICGVALKSSTTPEWDPNPPGSITARTAAGNYVKEARRRGLTPVTCFELLGRTTQVASSSGATGSKLASWDQSKLCKYALPRKDRSTVWDTSSYYGKYVTEAKRRGYTPQSCAKVLGRTTQVAKKSEPNKPKATPKPKAPELTTLDEAYVALKSANVRKGPDTAFEIVASLRKGDAITALGKVKDQDWYLIEKAGKKLGYVYGNLIAPEASQQVAALKPVAQPTTKASTPRLASTSDIHFGKYHALVIGNNDYQHLPDLKTAMADAKAVKEVLVNDYGFDTKLLLNATRDDLLEALDGYRERLQYDDNLLIYYAGHGVLDETQDRGYWLPVDANEDTRSRWVANDDITANLRSISAKHILVVADSCYSGTLTRSVSIKPNPKAERTALIRHIVKQRVRTALTSGGLEPVVDSGVGGHSVFAEAFLDALKANTDVLLGHELFTKIRGRVHLNAPQLPRYDNIRFSGHKEGDFLFVSKRTLKASVEEPSQTDVVFWQSVKDSSNADMVHEYLKQFPNGMFAGLARIRIKELEAAR